MKSAGVDLAVGQERAGDDITVTTSGRAHVVEICTTLPPGREPVKLDALDTPFPRSRHSVGSDTLLCATTEGTTGPIRVRFGLAPK